MSELRDAAASGVGARGLRLEAGGSLPGGPARSRWTGIGLLALVVLAQATGVWLPFPASAFGALVAAAAFAILLVRRRETWRGARRSTAVWGMAAGIALTGVVGGYSAVVLAAASLLLWPEAVARIRPVPPLAPLAGAAIAGASVLALALWVQSRGMFAFSPFPPAVAESGGLFFLVVVAVSLVNAVQEETLWRFLLPRLLGGPSAFTVTVTSLGFGLLHWNGIPSGPLGAAMTTVFAFAMHGLVRLGGGTLLWAILVHAIADFAVIYFLYG